MCSVKVSVLWFVLLLADFRHLGSENALPTANLTQIDKSTVAKEMGELCPQRFKHCYSFSSEEVELVLTVKSSFMGTIHLGICFKYNTVFRRKGASCFLV